MPRFVVYWFCVRSVDIMILIIVGFGRIFAPVNQQLRSHSCCHQIWTNMRIPRDRLGPSLFSFFYYAKTIILASLFPCTVFCHPVILRSFWSCYFNTKTSNPPPNCRYPYFNIHYHFLEFQSSCIWQHLDQSKVPRCSMAQNMGLRLVSRIICWCESCLIPHLQPWISWRCEGYYFYRPAFYLTIFLP